MDGVASISPSGKLLSLLGHIQFVVHVANGVVEKGNLSICLIKLSTWFAILLWMGFHVLNI